MRKLAYDETSTLIDELLAEQQQLTAVDRFVLRHGKDTVPAQARYYHDLIPLTKPQPGQQYAFEVDLDKCSGCKACVSACHSLNGLDDGETWRDVGLLFSDDWRQPFQQTVTTACHHCAEPACLNGCPVLAYDKDPLTGIVRHLDDQCIGCQYCVMKCPYDVPKYSAKRGIVRKCDMCANRLAVGEAPACVQACPSESISIAIVDHAEIAMAARRGEFLPGAPSPNITQPTTRYKSTRPLPANLLGGDHARVTPSGAHVPLVFMLVFTQLSVGASVASVVAEPARWLMTGAAITGALALGIATLHLGRPFKAWRAFLGWRKSWFSREVIVFGGYVPLTAVTALLLWLSHTSPEKLAVDEWKMLTSILKISAALAGLAGVTCSAMIYADTGREFWRASQCLGKFLGTTVLLGAVTSLALRELLALDSSTWFIALVGLVFVTTMVKLGLEHRIFRNLVDEDTTVLTSLNKTARLLVGKLGLPARIRIMCGILGGCVLPLLLLSSRLSGNSSGTTLAIVALIFCVAGELLERFLFFTAVATVKMPGGVAS